MSLELKKINNKHVQQFYFTDAENKQNQNAILSWIITFSSVYKQFKQQRTWVQSTAWERQGMWVIASNMGKYYPCTCTFLLHVIC